MDVQTSASEYVLKCKVSHGIFSDERGISIELPDRHVVAFVDRRDIIVSHDPELRGEMDGWVKVAVLILGEDSALVDLPRPALSQGTRLRVPRTMLRLVKEDVWSR